MSPDRGTATILRKACRHCTKSKRRCIIQLPSCVRCLQRGLQCTYDLEPLAVDDKKAHWHQDTSLTPPSRKANTFSDYCILHVVGRRNNGPLQTVFPVLASDKDALEYLLWAIIKAPRLVSMGQWSPFIHPKLHFQPYRRRLALANDVCRSVDNEYLQELLNVDMYKAPLGEALAALQILELYLSVHLFDSDPVVQEKAEVHLPLLLKWSDVLLTSAWYRVPEGQSPWQTWLLGESTRRTITISNLIVGAHSSWKYGYCMHRLALEALPFDSRRGLWQANSQQAWIQAAGARNADDVGTHLMSLHEFAGNFPISESSIDDDTFMSMVLVAHNGKKDSCPRTASKTKTN